SLRLGAGHLLRLSGDAHESAQRLRDGIVAGPVRIRPGLSEAGDRAVDQSRMQLAQRVVVELVAREIADLVVLHQHVALRGQGAHQLLPFGIGEIDGDRLLAAVAAGEVRRLGGVVAARVLDERRAPAAGIVAAAGALHLDYFGAEVGEDLRCEGPREHAGEIENPDAGQRAHQTLVAASTACNACRMCCSPKSLRPQESSLTTGDTEKEPETKNET